MSDFIQLLFFDYVIILLTVFFCIYYYSTKTYKYWEEHGIKYVKPIPFFGNMLDFMIGKKNIVVCHQEIYKQLEDEPYGGWFMYRSPQLLLRDPNIIHQLLVTDFSHFCDRISTFDPNLDPLHANLVNLTGHQWKSLRQKLTPAFSSSRIKLMFEQFNECSDNLHAYFDEKINNNKLVEIGEAMAKFSTDVIGSCAFGLQFNSLKDPNSEFRKVGRDILLPTFRVKLRIFLKTIHEDLPSVFRVRRFKKQHENFFMNLVKDTIKYREENKIERNDFLQILMMLKKQDAIENLQAFKSDTKEGQVILDDVMLVSNTFAFFIAGFATTSLTMAYCLLELAINHEIQEKLRNEVREVKKNHGKISYEAIKKMDYMECVISEALRKYPAVSSVVRCCTKPYLLPGSKKSLKVGDKILVPVYAIHRDPNYYPKPEEFDPDRFKEENKAQRVPAIYLPFGDGPRSCIGIRFAKTQMKIAISNIILSYSLTLNEKTTLPLTWKPRALHLVSEQKIFLNLKRINE